MEVEGNLLCGFFCSHIVEMAIEIELQITFPDYSAMEEAMINEFYTWLLHITHMEIVGACPYFCSYLQLEGAVVQMHPNWPSFISPLSLIVDLYLVFYEL